MGISGCGKTTYGIFLSKVLCCDYYDGDDFHSLESIEKIKNKIFLNDEDRKEWLDKIKNIIDKYINKKNVVISCSCLKKEYRIK